MDKKGSHSKFVVIRKDGQDMVGAKHYDCQYFVLDITHDPFAASAIRAYAEVCKDEKPELSDDLMELAEVWG